MKPIEKKQDVFFESETNDLICLSHLRWDFVFQRPQHLMTRFAKNRRVFYVEEPIWIDQDAMATLNVSNRGAGLYVVVPQIPGGRSHDDVVSTQRRLLNQLIREFEISEPTLWYYTPMALSFSDHLDAHTIIYDCMDELSAFKGAPVEMLENEQRLFKKASLVFTGGHTLYEAKKNQHHSCHAFPSSIDGHHFEQARAFAHKLSAKTWQEPADQASIPGPRLGFFGVIDERMDIELVEGVAKLRPDWHIVMIGPVVKIDPATLPQQSNIHYLGGKTYQELPSYIAGWDLAFLPFARNESTRFISPTKTPEYLAAGKPVVSTSIRDVIHPYGREDLVAIADTPEKFVEAAEEMMERAKTDAEWRQRVDLFLSNISWDQTWAKMAGLETDVATAHERLPFSSKLDRQNADSFAYSMNAKEMA